MAAPVFFIILSHILLLVNFTVSWLPPAFATIRGGGEIYPATSNFMVVTANPFTAICLIYFIYLVIYIPLLHASGLRVGNKQLMNIYSN